MTTYNNFGELSNAVPSEYLKLKESGLSLLQEIKLEISEDLNYWEDHNPLAIIMAKALVWSDYANKSDDSFNYLVDFIDANAQVVEAEFEKASGRMGFDNLKKSAQAYRAFLNHIKRLDFSIHTATTKDLLSRNRSWLSWVERMKTEGKLSGFGTWFFSVTFYGIICLREDLWHQSELESVLMPFGVEVNRGLKKAKKAGLPALQAIDENKFRRNEQNPYEINLNENYSTLLQLQSYINEIAKITGTGVIVINAGLYNLGRGELNF